MACTEHNCLDCKHVWFNNVAREPCPRCGSRYVQHLFDELPDTDVYDEREDDEREEG